MTALALPFLVTWLVLVLLYVLAMAVGYARVKFNVRAPATSGNEDFERVFRVQANTLENAVFFLPMMWIYTLTVGPFWPSILGFIWLFGRVVYAVGYYRSPKLRQVGAPLYFPVTILVILGAAYGIWNLLQAAG
jgi:glutathione S-transferase